MGICNRVAATILASTALSLARFLTWGGYFFMIAMVVIAIALALHAWLPETKGKTLEEMSKYFMDINEDKTGLLSMDVATFDRSPTNSQELSVKRACEQPGLPAPELLGKPDQTSYPQAQI